MSPPAPPTGQRITSAGGIALDGARLVVPNGYVFPPICPVTGETTGLEAPLTRRRVSNAHKTALGKTAIGLLNGPIGLIAASRAAAKDYTYTFRPSLRATRRWKLVRRLGILMIIAACYGFGKGLSLESIPVLSASMVLFGLGCITSVGFFDSVAVTRVRNGQLWLTGIPRRISEKIVEIEHGRIEAARRAALAQQQASAASSLHGSPFVAAGPPPLPPGWQAS